MTPTGPRTTAARNSDVVPFTTHHLRNLDQALQPAILKLPFMVDHRQDLMALLTNANPDWDRIETPLDQSSLDAYRSIVAMAMMLPPAAVTAEATAALTILIPDATALRSMVQEIVFSHTQGANLPLSWCYSGQGHSWIPAIFHEWVLTFNHPRFTPSLNLRWICDPSFPLPLRQVRLNTPDVPADPPSIRDLRPPVTAATYNALRMRLAPWALPWCDPPRPLSDIVQLAARDLFSAVAVVCNRHADIHTGWSEMAALFNISPVIGLSDTVIRRLMAPMTVNDIHIASRWRSHDLDSSMGLTYTLSERQAPNASATASGDSTDHTEEARPARRSAQFDPREVLAAFAEQDKGQAITQPAAAGAMSEEGEGSTEDEPLHPRAETKFDAEEVLAAFEEQEQGLAEQSPAPSGLEQVPEDDLLEGHQDSSSDVDGHHISDDLGEFPADPPATRP